MSTGLEIRPVQSSSVALARLELGPERQIARTELPETQVVLSAPESQLKNSAQDEQAKKIRAVLNTKIDELQAAPVKKIDFDNDTQELVFRTVNIDTGKVVSQFPDEAFLRQRAYANRIEKAEFFDQEKKVESSSVEHVEKLA